MSYEVKVTKNGSTLVIEREFDGSQEQVWDAYTKKALFEKWWGPEGWETTAKTFDFVPGGKVHYGMKCVDEAQGEWFGKFSWGVMVLDLVDAPHRFSYSDYFSDEEGVLNQDMPALKITNEFVSLGDNKSKLVSTSHADSPEQIEELVKMGMIEGFTSQLTKLDQLLAA